MKKLFTPATDSKQRAIPMQMGQRASAATETLPNYLSPEEMAEFGL
jgi:hypothetical protein